MKVLDERFVSWSEAKKLLEKKGKDKELGYEQKNALDHLKKFFKLSEKKANEMIEELRKIERLRERQIMSIVNMLPQNQDEVNMLFANEVINLSDEEKKKILGIVKKFT